MKTYDATRQELRRANWSRGDETVDGVHRETWWSPSGYPYSYQSACRKVGIVPVLDPPSQDPRPAYKRKKDRQAKHLDTRKVLAFIVDHCKKTGHLWTTYYDFEREFPDFDKFPTKVVRAKMAYLVAKGFLDGCLCGCRGDFEPQRAAYDFLAQNRSRDDIKPGCNTKVNDRPVRDLWFEGKTMCFQFHDTGEIVRLRGARAVSMSSSFENATVEGDKLVVRSEITYEPVLEMIPITFLLDGEAPPK